MPLLRAIIVLDDGFTFIRSDGTSRTVTSDDLSPAQKLMTPAQLEAIAVPLLQSRLQGSEFVGLHLTSVVPLQGLIQVSTEPVPSNWWQIQ